jgi:basic membrane protein A and related proteins
MDETLHRKSNWTQSIFMLLIATLLVSNSGCGLTDLQQAVAPILTPLPAATSLPTLTFTPTITATSTLAPTPTNTPTTPPSPTPVGFFHSRNLDFSLIYPNGWTLEVTDTQIQLSDNKTGIFFLGFSAEDQTTTTASAYLIQFTKTFRDPASKIFTSSTLGEKGEVVLGDGIKALRQAIKGKDPNGLDLVMQINCVRTETRVYTFIAFGFGASMKDRVDLIEGIYKSIRLGSLAACGSASVFCVGMVMDVGGSVDDKTFNQSAWEVLLQARKDLGATVKAIKTTDSKDYGKNIAALVDARYNVIVTVGAALGDATIAAAKRYPNVRFIGVDQLQGAPLPNLAGVIFNEDQVGYLAGTLAALMSKSGKIGAVCGPDAAPPVWRFCEGYRAGAKAAKPAIEVNVVYYNDVDMGKAFNDSGWGSTTAFTMIGKGVDVIFGAAGKTGNGALQAAAEKGVYVIGVPTTFNLIKLALYNTFSSGNIVGEVGMAPYHDLDSKVPADVKAKISGITRGLNEGTIKTNVPPAKP